MHQAQWSPQLAMPAAQEKEAGAAVKRIKAALKSIGERLPLGAAFFLLSLAQCLTAPSPYAVCFLAALLNAGVRPKGALLGLGAGLLFRVAWGLPWDAGQFAACLLCFPLLKKPSEKTFRLLAVTAALLALRAVPGIAAAQTVLDVILHVSGVAVGVALMPALGRAARIWSIQARRITADDALCLCLPVLLMLSGAGRLLLGPVNAGYLAAVYAVVAVAWLCGSAAGAVAGMGCGMALLLGGQSALMLLALSLGGLLAGMFQGRKRPAAAGLYLASAVIITYLAAHGFSPSLFFGGLAGCGAFCLTPERWMKRAGMLIRRLRWNAPRENAYMRLNMQRWVRAIDRLAGALPHPRMDPGRETEESDRLGEWLCGDCDRLAVCWGEDQAAATQAGLRELTEQAEDQDSELERINRHFSGCGRIGKIPALLCRLDEERRERAQRVLCAEYERDMLEAHLTALSQAAQRISLEGESRDGEEAYWMAQAEEALQAIHFPGQAAFVKRVDGRLTVCLRYEPMALHPQAGEEIARRLGLQLHAALVVAEQTGDRILLEEPPPLRVVTGMATVCANPREHKRSTANRTDNGDAVLVQPLNGGQTLLAISDGMGHGADAQAESRKTLELLSMCMEAGYSRAQAMTVVNGSMLSATGGERFATVDLCLIDLWTGEAAMNKLGACGSFLLQGQKIKTIEGAALPLGIIEHVIPMEYRFHMGEGDTLVLMSDGVADAFAREEGIIAVLRERRDCGPKRLADALLRAAVERRDGAPTDDMTVLCARVEEREQTA